MPRKTKRKKSLSIGERLTSIFGNAAPALAWASWIVAAAALGTGAVYGVPRLEERVVTGVPATTRVEFEPCPAWVRDDVREELVDVVRSTLTADVLSRRDLVRAHDALLSTGWFEEVEQVRRLDAAAVCVTATFATPFAVVVDGAGEHLLSADGRLLPRVWPIGQAPAGLFRIAGTYFDRPTIAGRPWDGGDVAAAIAVLRLLEGREWRDQIVGADASAYLTEGLLHLVTDRGSRIVWGAAPGEEAALEVHAGEKLRRLDTAVAQCGHVDCGFPGEVDVTNPAGVIAR